MNFSARQASTFDVDKNVFEGVLRVLHSVCRMPHSLYQSVEKRLYQSLYTIIWEVKHGFNQCTFYFLIEVAPEESKKPKLHQEHDGPNPFFKAGFFTKEKLMQFREVFNEQPSSDADRPLISHYHAWLALEQNGCPNPSEEAKAKIFDELDITDSRHVAFG